MDADHVALVMAQWRRERPDLDVAPLGVIARLHRVANRLTEELVAVHAEFGLDEGEFDVLATLRRNGAPYEMTAGALGAASVVSSGAITKRVDRCVRAGLATRRPGEGDGRSRLVALTDRGLDVIDRAFAAHVANEHRLLAELPVADRAELERALTGWARSLGV